MAPHHLNGRVLIVAGSDSGGGAGIQADIKTVTALGGYAATAVTALTVQNTLGVQDVLDVPPEFVASQIKAVLTDIGADVIKTGMLSSASIVEAVAEALHGEGSNIPVVVDPVMVAKGGASLLKDDAVEAMMTQLIPVAAVITPNLPEAEALTGLKIKTESDMEGAVERLRALGAGAIVLKGGHLDGDRVVDLLITADSVERFESHKISSSHTHGTGCTLASAIATGLAQGSTVSEAVTMARSYVLEAIKSAPGLGTGHGPLNHGHVFIRSGG